ncbi:MAG: alanyl-tRNA editing protein [Eubacteriales bacterium]
MTEKLYLKDAYTRAFQATVLSCHQAGEVWQVLLDQTAFFPEGGGQAADRGTLNGVAVLDVQENEGGILHKTPSPFPVGERVEGKIDWDMRFRRMQNHTGEHILSGLAHRLWGVQNVGFHLGSEEVTMDFDRELSKENLTILESSANEAVVSNAPVSVLYPTARELSAMTYRSKIELGEDARIVRIEGYDSCACCAPHVGRTGELGLVKILDARRYKGGMRLSIKCGFDALDDYRVKYDNLLQISRLLSAKQHESAEALKRLLTEVDGYKQQLHALRSELLSFKVAALPTTEGHIILFDPTIDMLSMRQLANEGMERCGGICAVFDGEESAGQYRFVMGSRHIQMQAVAALLTDRLGAACGGSAAMITGKVTASAEQIRQLLQEVSAEADRPAAPFTGQ